MYVLIVYRIILDFTRDFTIGRDPYFPKSRFHNTTNRQGKYLEKIIYMCT